MGSNHRPSESESDVLPTELYAYTIHGETRTRNLQLRRLLLSSIELREYSAAHRIRTCKSFQTNGFQDRSLTTRTYGILCYKGDEDRTHTYGIKTRCAAITLRPYHDRREIRTPGSAKISRLPNGCIRPLYYPAIRQRVDSNHRNGIPFNSLAGSRNRPTLPRCHITAPNLPKNMRFGAVSYLRQDSNLQSTD